MNIGELKRMIAHLPDETHVEFYDVTYGRNFPVNSAERKPPRDMAGHKTERFVMTNGFRK